MPDEEFEKVEDAQETIDFPTQPVRRDWENLCLSGAAEDRGKYWLNPSDPD